MSHANGTTNMSLDGHAVYLLSVPKLSAVAVRNNAADRSERAHACGRSYVYAVQRQKYNDKR